MKLSEILQCENMSGELLDIEIDALAFDSREVRDKTLFFCLEGGLSDKSRFVPDAVKRGAAAIVTSRAQGCGIPEVIVADTRAALSYAAAAFYGYPSRRMKTAAITGTNGKTTTAHILKSILEQAGEVVGIIGTNGISYPGVFIQPSMTTPDPIEYNRVLRDMADSGVTAVVSEVSAHALYYKKCDGIVFDVAAFTNLSRDHLDFFASMDEYAAAKRRLFTPERCKAAVINVDDEQGRRILGQTKVSAITYGAENPSDAFAVELKMTLFGLSYVLNINDDIAGVTFCLPGRFNMYNTLCAAAMARVLGVSMRHIAAGIRGVKKVEGRFDCLHTPRATVIIDFAHTDDGLRNVLTAIREFAHGRIITVFGCGGNRDRTKRPIMGAAVSELSDLTVITSDNPRDENPDDIIAEVASGIAAGKPCMRIVDRKAAILAALQAADEGDVVLIAGKGAEKYQEIRGVKQPYNDEEYVLRLIGERAV